MFKKFKKKITSLLSICLAITLSLTALPATAYAEGTVQGDNGGSATGGMSASTDVKAWSHTDAGLRFYVVNADLERVSAVYDYVFSDPTVASENVGEVLYSTRFDTATSPDTIYMNTISTLAEITGSSISEIPYPIKNNEAHGVEIKQWFLKGIPYSNSDSDNGNNGIIIPYIYTGNMSNIGNTQVSNTDNSTETQRTEEEIITQALNDLKEADIDNYNSMQEGINNLNTSADTFAMLAGISTEEKEELYDYGSRIGSIAFKNLFISCKSKLAMINPDYRNLDLLVASMIYGEVMQSARDRGKSGTELLKTQCLVKYELEQFCKSEGIIIDTTYLAKATSEQSSLTAKLFILSEDIENKAITSNTQGISLLKQNIPLYGGSESESISGAPALLMLNRTDTIQVPGYDTPFAAMQDGHLLVIESISWIYVAENGANYQSYKTYGSYYNIVNKWKNVGGTEGSNFYWSYTTNLGNNCMLLQSKVETETGKIWMPASSRRRTISESVAEMETSGLSMHMYTSASFGATAKVIKNYIDKDDKVVKNTQGSIGGTSYSISNETGYSVVKWETSTVEHEATIDNTQTWDNLTSTSTKTQSGTGTSNINVSSTEKVIYIQLKVRGTNVDGDWKLTESELSKSFTDTFDASYTWNSLNYNCSGHCPGYCSGHTDYCYDWEVEKGICNNETASGDCGGHNESCPSHGKCKSHSDASCNCSNKDYCTWTIDDSTLNFSRTNTLRTSYPNIQAINDTFKDNLTQNQSYTRTLAANTNHEEKYTYDFVLFRGQDKVTLNNRADEADTGNTNASKLFSTNTYSNNQRKTDSYTEDFKIQLDHSSSADFSSSAKTDDPCKTRTDTATIATQLNDVGEAVEQQNTTVSGKVEVEVYSGENQANIHTSLKTDKLLRFTSTANDKTAGRQVYSGGTIYFNPYIRMTIQTLNGTKQNVNVLSEFVRTIVPNDYAEISWTQKENNLTVDSYMWAVDTKLTSGDKGWNQLNQVLKGGATHTLTVPEYQEVTVRTYQTILAGDQSLASSYTEGTLTEENAKIEHQGLVEQVKNSLDTLELELWVSTETNDDTAWDNGIAVTYGSDISDLKNTKQNKNEASKDTKYYLQDAINDKSNISRADLDGQVALTTLCKYYRIWSDVEGNVYLTEGDSVSATFTNAKASDKILIKTQGIESISGDAKRLNLRTGVVEKFISAIERNTGNDTSASWATSDGHWYNEAYSGVIIMEQSTSIKVDLGDLNQRMSVLDPKLIPLLESKNEQNTTAHLAQYKCKPATALSAEVGHVGTFKGQAVYMSDMDLLYTSQPFFITNSTVQNHD